LPNEAGILVPVGKKEIALTKEVFKRVTLKKIHLLKLQAVEKSV